MWNCEVKSGDGRWIVLTHLCPKNQHVPSAVVTERQLKYQKQRLVTYLFLNDANESVVKESRRRDRLTTSPHSLVSAC